MRAFLSYRRGDNGVHSDLLERLVVSLRELGFTTVFYDIDAIEPTTDWLAEIYKGVTEADLVVALIGTRWLEILEARSLANASDILRKELSLAFDMDKTVLPLLIDAAMPPNGRNLPRDIARLARCQARSISSSATVASLAGDLKVAAARASELAQGHALLRPALIAVLSLCYLFVALGPNAIGLREYGLEAWTPLAFMWAGFFIWPVLFLPFVLSGLYGPSLTLLIRFVKARDNITKLRYAAPFLIAALLAAMYTSIDTTKDEAPWTLRPSQGLLAATEPSAPLMNFDLDRSLARTYEASGEVPFWLIRKHKWPSVFFYLTMPPQRGLAAAKYRRDSATSRDLYHRLVTGGRQAMGFRHSNVFTAYVASLFIASYMAFLVFTMLILLVGFGVTAPNNELVYGRRQTEDTYISLTYAFLAGCSWFPFRLPTHVFKSRIYQHYQPTDYFADLLLLVLVACICMLLSFGLVWRFGRGRAAGLGLLILLIYALVAATLPRFIGAIVSLGWNAYIGLAICCCLALYAIRPYFSPYQIRRRDFVAELSTV